VAKPALVTWRSISAGDSQYTQDVVRGPQFVGLGVHGSGRY